MIDFNTYKQLHSDSPKFSRAYPQLNKRDRKEISAELMKLDQPPSAPDRMVFPHTIIGYNLRQKKWGEFQETSTSYPIQSYADLALVQWTSR